MSNLLNCTANYKNFGNTLGELKDVDIFRFNNFTKKWKRDCKSIDFSVLPR